MMPGNPWGSMVLPMGAMQPTDLASPTMSEMAQWMASGALPFDPMPPFSLMALASMMVLPFTKKTPPSLPARPPTFHDNVFPLPPPSVAPDCETKAVPAACPTTISARNSVAMLALPKGERARTPTAAPSMIRCPLSVSGIGVSALPRTMLERELVGICCRGGALRYRP